MWQISATTAIDLVVLVGVALEVDFCALRHQALTTFAAAVLDDATTRLRLHARTESVLLLAAALGWLESPFHGWVVVIFLKNPNFRRGLAFYRFRPACQPSLASELLSLQTFH